MNRRMVIVLVIIVFLAAAAAVSFFVKKKIECIECIDRFIDKTPIIVEPIKEISIIVSSCDKYSELWEPHFTQLFKYWPSLKKENDFIPLLLITNHKRYYDSRVINVVIGEDISWSDNMLKALEMVKTKYVVILLDDFI